MAGTLVEGGGEYVMRTLIDRDLPDEAFEGIKQEEDNAWRALRSDMDANEDATYNHLKFKIL